MSHERIAPGLPGGDAYRPEMADPHGVRMPHLEQHAQHTPPAAAYEVSAASMAAATREPARMPADDLNRVEFSRAYSAHGDSVLSVTFRPPVGRDVTRVGVPFRFVQPEEGGDQGEMKVISQLVTRYIVELSQPPLPRSTVDEFDMADWNACSRVICGFFQS